MPRTRSVAWSEVKLGIVGVAALVLATMMILAIGGETGFFTERYPLKVRFDDVQGLKAGAVVRLGGKQVGQVTAVEFAGAEIDVTLELLAEVRGLITDQSRASIGAVSLLGEPNIEIVPAATGTPLGDWEYVPSTAVAGLAGVTATAERALTQVEQLLADIRRGEGTLGKLITDDAVHAEMERLLASAAEVTEAINSGQGTIGQLIRDPAAANAFKAAVENLQTMTARINAGEGALGRFLNDEGMADSLSNTMANLERATGRMTSGEGTMAKLINDSEVHDRLSSLLTRIDALLANLEAGRGTAGQLLQNQQLYDNINATVTQVMELLAAIQADPRKYLQVRVSIF